MIGRQRPELGKHEPGNDVEGIDRDPKNSGLNVSLEVEGNSCAELRGPG